ncbi:hypothetical protein RKD27_000009 [Streptomyces sp. SAI-126]
MGHDVMSRNDDQKAPHAGDAWVDDKRAEFKVPRGLNTNQLSKHLKKADREQRVDVVYVDLRPVGMDEDGVNDALRQWNPQGTVQRVVFIGRDYVVDHEV